MLKLDESLLHKVRRTGGEGDDFFLDAVEALEDVDVLRAGFLTCATAYAGCGHLLTLVESDDEEELVVCAVCVLKVDEIVKRSEGAGDADALRANLCAIIAARAGNDLARAHALHNLVHSCHLGFGKRLEVLQQASIVLDVLDGAHAGENAEHTFRASGESERSGCVRVIGELGVDDVFNRLRRVGEKAALDGLHDEDGHAMLVGYLNAFAFTERGVVPVGVVDLKKDELGIRIFVDKFFKLFGGAVCGEADVLGEAAFFNRAHELPYVVLAEACRAISSEVMHEVDVKVVNAKVLEGFLKLLLEILLALAVISPRNALRADEIGIPGISLDERFLEGCFTVGISPCGIEVVAACFDVGINHFLGVLDVDFVLLSTFETHAAEAQLADLIDFQSHLIPLCIRQ